MNDKQQGYICVSYEMLRRLFHQHNHTLDRSSNRKTLKDLIQYKTSENYGVMIHL